MFVPVLSDDEYVGVWSIWGPETLVLVLVIASHRGLSAIPGQNQGSRARVILAIAVQSHITVKAKRVVKNVCFGTSICCCNQS